jgi:chromosome segregation ATPase
MATPIDPTSPGVGGPSSASRTEELRDKLRPRDVVRVGEPQIPAGERLALERVQTLELQLARAHDRERELTELAVRDGNRVATLEGAVRDLAERAARADAAEQALFEAENRAETALRRAELMESELMASRAEVDRLRTRVVELEASLRRALAEVGAATAQRAQLERGAAEEDAARLEASAERSLELADRLRVKVADLEADLRTVLQEAGVASDTVRRTELSAEPDVPSAGADDARTSAAEAESRLADLERRLTSLDERIAGLSDVARVPDDEDASEEPDDTLIDLREAEADAGSEETDADADADADAGTQAGSEEAVAPSPSRWSKWRAT